jgi:hypothetical protein
VDGRERPAVQVALIVDEQKAGTGGPIAFRDHALRQLRLVGEDLLFADAREPEKEDVWHGRGAYLIG